MCASIRSGARSVESARHEVGHFDRTFIHENCWVNLLVLMALSAASKVKQCCPSANFCRGSSPPESMKVLAQIEFRLYLLDAASCTKITITDSIQIEYAKIRCIQILMRASLSCSACVCIKVCCHNHTIKALNQARIARKLGISTWSDKNNSWKQTYRPVLLSKAGTNANWASRPQHHFTVSLWNVAVSQSGSGIQIPDRELLVGDFSFNFGTLYVGRDHDSRLKSRLGKIRIPLMFRRGIQFSTVTELESTRIQFWPMFTLTVTRSCDDEQEIRIYK